MRAYQFLKSNNSVLKIDQQTYESNISFSDYERAVMEGGHSLDKPKSALHQAVTEIVNTSIMKQGWKKHEHRDGLDLRAEANEEGLSIFAYDAGGREIGFVHFEIIDDKLESFDTWVDSRMRRQGIATVMYNYAKELGNDIAPSTAQTPDGKKFWKSIKQQATENFADGKNPQDKGDSNHFEFLGQYPSIRTRLKEDKYPGVINYNDQQQKKLHQELDITRDADIGTYDRFGDKKHWHDLAFVQDYSENSKDLNNYLHNHYRNKPNKKNAKQFSRHIQAMDRALTKNKLKKQIVVYTGVIESPANIWEIYNADVSKPIRLHLPAYTSTTTNLSTAVDHATDHKDVMGKEFYVSRQRHIPRNKNAPNNDTGIQILMLILPTGTLASSIKNVSEWEAENEILLPRGGNIEVDPRPTVTRQGVHIWHARLLGYSPVVIESITVDENFADGKNPEHKGDSKRHGIPKHATLAQLDKIAHEGGRRGQLAHWQTNMRRGRK